MEIKIEKEAFISSGSKCSGLLYRPLSQNPVPIMVMAHGFACQQDFALPDYARCFAEEGIAVLSFDYRYFGESEGKPRQLLNIKKQIEDWHAAIDHAKTLPGVDPDRLIIWGSSLSGGHVLETASQRSDIALVLAHVPFTDGLTVFKLWRGSDLLRLTGAGILDLITAISGKAYYIPAVESPGRLGCMTQEGMKESYLAMVPEDTDWINHVPARICLAMLFYRPGKKAGRIQCPVLIISGDQDKAVYTPAAQKASSQIADNEFISLPMGHCDAYVPGIFMNQVMDLQLNFIHKHILS